MLLMSIQWISNCLAPHLFVSSEGVGELFVVDEVVVVEEICHGLYLQVGSGETCDDGCGDFVVACVVAVVWLWRFVVDGVMVVVSFWW